jgi:predicted RecA/RadA family phage recombinase
MGKYNYVFSGAVIPILAPRDVESGEGLLIKNLFGIVGNTVKKGEATELILEGVFRLPKAQVKIELGQCVYWKVDDRVTTHPEEGSLIGVSIQSVGELDELVEVKLEGGGVAQLI